MPVYESNFNTLLAEALETRMPGWNIRAQSDASADSGTRKHPDASAGQEPSYPRAGTGGINSAYRNGCRPAGHLLSAAPRRVGCLPPV